MKTGNETCGQRVWDAPQREALWGARWIWWCAWIPFVPPIGRAWLAPVEAADPGWAQERWLEICTVVLYWLAIAGWLALVPLAYFIRNQIYKAHWRGDAVSPAGYEQANVNLFLILEIPCILGYLAYELTAVTTDLVLPLAVTAVFLLLNFPSGKPMHPTSPRLGVPEK